MLISFGMSGVKNSNKTNKTRLWKRIAAATALLIPQVLFLILSPAFFKDKLDSDPYSEWLQLERESAVSVIKVWHIVGFKPYAGSLGGWLKDVSESYSKAYFGIYIEVGSYTSEEANERLARGLKPDVISYSGERPTELLPCLSSGENGVMYCALPYCASGRVLVYDPVKTDASDVDALINIAGTPEEFKKGRTDCYVCDIRGAGDLMRAQLLGKCPYFEVEPIGASNELVQYIGIVSDADPVKLPYLIGFVKEALSPECQSKLAQLGLIPADAETEVRFDEAWMDSLRDIVNESGLLASGVN